MTGAVVERKPMAKHVATTNLGFNPKSYEQNTAKSVKNAYAQTAGGGTRFFKVIDAWREEGLMQVLGLR